MMIIFETSNAAFDEDSRDEIVRILNGIEERVYLGHKSGVIRDINGNRIGRFCIGKQLLPTEEEVVR